MSFRFFTPVIFISLLPAPTIFAPILLSILAKSIISGSIAAFLIVVVPSAKTDTSIIFSVAPTLGKSNCISAEVISSVLHFILPDSSFIFIPSVLKAFKCKSIGLVPMSHPPWV